MEQFQLIFELIGTVAFAISGAMLGIRKGLDLFGVSMTGMLTTVGGGILRDTILGRTPPAALTDPLEALMAIGVSMLVFLICARLHPCGEHRYADLLLLVADSIGLGVFTANGACSRESAAEFCATSAAWSGPMSLQSTFTPALRSAGRRCVCCFGRLDRMRPCSRACSSRLSCDCARRTSAGACRACGRGIRLDRGRGCGI